MSNKKQKMKNKRSGHYCWSCGRRRANEKFSGKGHARCLCKDCQRLGAEELEYRQARINLEKCLSWNGIIRRKARKQFKTFLEHDNPRIRELAEEMQAHEQQERAEMQAIRDAEDAYWQPEYQATQEACQDMWSDPRDLPF